MKKILFLLFFLSVIAASIWFFFIQNSYRNPFIDADPIEAIPTYAPVILEFQDYFLLRHAIAKMPYSEEMSKAFFVKKMSDDFDRIRELFSNNTNHRSLLIESPITASMHLSSQVDMDFLYVFQDKKAVFKLEELLDAFPSKTTVSQGRTVYTITLSNQKNYTIAHSNGLILISKYAYLVENGIKQLSDPSKNLLNNKDYGFSKQSIKNKYQVNVSVLFKNLKVLISPFIKKKAPDYFGFIANQFSIGQWVLDFHEEGVQFVGGINLKNENALLGELAKDVKNSNSAFAKILPKDMAYFYRQSIKDKKEATTQGNLFKEYFQPWMGNEFLVGRTEIYTRKMKSEKFVAMPSTDFKTSQYYLEKLSDSLAVLKSWNYQTYPIRQIALDALPVPFTDEEMFDISNPYYTIIENYVIFAGGGRVLEKWIDQFLTGQTLANHIPFIKMKGRSGQSQIVEGYWNFRNTKRLIDNILVANSESLFEQLQLWEAFPSIGINGRLENNKFSTNGFFYYQKEKEKRTKVKWKSSLLANAHTQPFPIFNDEKGAYDIFIQDEDNQLYSINTSGEENWSLRLDAPIMSEIYAAEFEEDESRWILFNTKNKIYLMDLGGEMKNEFPIRLTSPASNSLLLADFGENDFGIFIACENELLYGFDKNGIPLSGWQSIEGAGLVRQQVQHFQTSNEDFIVVHNIKGDVFSFNKNGFEEMSARNITSYSPAPLCLQLQEDQLVVADKNGDPIELMLNGGENNLLQSGEVKQEIYKYTSADIGGDNLMDYAILDKNNLKIFYRYQDSFQEFGQYNFSTSPSTIFNARSNTMGKSKIGAMDYSLGQIYLFDKKGNLHQDFPLAGTTNFKLVNLYQDDVNMVLVADGDVVVLYELGE